MRVLIVEGMGGGGVGWNRKREETEAKVEKRPKIEGRDEWRGVAANKGENREDLRSVQSNDRRKSRVPRGGGKHGGEPRGKKK